MKYAVLIGDGMADYPVDELGGRTPLESARTPNMDMVTKEGIGGKVRTLPDKMEPSSDVAILSLLGYDPLKCYTGRGPLEAASMGISLKGDEVAFRCNLITADGDTLADYSAGHITNKEARVLIQYMNERLGSEEIRFYPGVSYRNLMVIKIKERIEEVQCTPPHNIIGGSIEKNLPQGEGSDVLKKLILDSREILEKHDINKVRKDLKENPANMVWLWGQGRSPSLESFQDRFKLKGAIISAVDVVKGIGKCLHLKVIDVPGATGYYDTNYEGKVEHAQDYLRDGDLVIIHVEAPDEAGHEGDAKAKVRAIENFDRRVVGPMFGHLRGLGSYKLLFLADHPTPVKIRTHTGDEVPFAIAGKGVDPDDTTSYSEKLADSGSIHFQRGYELMGYFLKE